MTPVNLISQDHTKLLDRKHKYIDHRIIETLEHNLTLGKKVLKNFPDLNAERIFKIIEAIQKPEFNNVFAKGIVTQDKVSDEFNLPFAIYMQAAKGIYRDEMEDGFRAILSSCAISEEELLIAGRINYAAVNIDQLIDQVSEFLSSLSDHERLLVIKVTCPSDLLSELRLGFLLTVSTDEFELLAWLGIASIEISDMYEKEHLYSDRQVLARFYERALFFTNDISKTVLSLTLKYSDEEIDTKALENTITSKKNHEIAANARAGITSRKMLTDTEKQQIKDFALSEWPSLPEGRNSNKMMAYYIIDNLDCAKDSKHRTILDLLTNLKQQVLKK